MRTNVEPRILLCSLLAGLLLACSGEPAERSATGGPAPNPPAAGFDQAGSDRRAIEIADATMAAMGGRDAWDRTRFVAWNFFGRRYHVWDKWTGQIRVESPGMTSEEPVVVVMNLNTREGRAWIGGEPVSDPQRVSELLERAREAWINDAYWLFMPYKLKDSGVTLKYVGTQPMLDERPADVLELTFREVGVTPENKYRVYVAQDTRLVEQWDFYASAADAEPRFRTPWHDWQPYGAILLSGDRGERKLSEIAVFDEVPAAVFESPQPTGLRPEPAPPSS